MLPIDEEDEDDKSDKSDDDNNNDDDDVNKISVVKDEEDVDQNPPTKKFLNYKPTTKLPRRGTAMPVKLQPSTTSTDDAPVSSTGRLTSNINKFSNCRWFRTFKHK